MFEEVLWRLVLGEAGEVGGRQVQEQGPRGKPSVGKRAVIRPGNHTHRLQQPATRSLCPLVSDHVVLHTLLLP
jgi:hypothetical protein